jgi:oxygen-independent coproporphyrinogen-3 oxidase
MTFVLEHGFVDIVQTISQIFYPHERFTVVDSPSADGITVVSGLERNAIYVNGSMVLEKHGELKRSLYELFCDYTQFKPKWGMLTGIRPTKLYHIHIRNGLPFEKIHNIISTQYDISHEKSELCFRVAKNELATINTFDKKAVSVYVNIPFCPSRCGYCSFTSNPPKPELMERYIECLEKEIKSFDLPQIDSIYIGGGTPTALDTPLLSRVLKLFQPQTEYTVEAGRPDTITKEKLDILAEHGITRISVNPQSMRNDTLQKIGRGHTVEDFYRAYDLARQYNFTINVDLIAGLPNETHEDLQSSINKVLELQPENITVHVLAIKKASRFKDEGYIGNTKNELNAIDIPNYEPYYLYRQKNMIGNSENVGYTLNGMGCRYNVMMMAETNSVVAFGADAVTKTVVGDRIERQYNVKDINEYMTRIDEMISKKHERLRDII